MLSRSELAAIGEVLATTLATPTPAVFDGRIDSAGLAEAADPDLVLHVKHQALLRCYQSRYILLPSATPVLPIRQWLQHYYGAGRVQALASAGQLMEAELIAPLHRTAVAKAEGLDCASHVSRLVRELNEAAEDPFIEALRRNPQREHHYRNFLVQSSIDLLAEASAAAFGVIGEFGPAQSALFRILMDEFGCGSHRKKHSVMFRATLRSFGLSDEYNVYWQRFSTPALWLHNTIHYLFQHPGHLFEQIGFLLHAETAYRRATSSHARYLDQFHPAVDSRYFSEHAHIDLHHTQMVVDEVIAPLLALYGADAGRGIVAGADLTRVVFDHYAQHLQDLIPAFDNASAAVYGMDKAADPALGQLVTPASVADPSADLEPDSHVEIGGLGTIGDLAAFAHFPAGTVGRIRIRSGSHRA